MTFVDLQRSDPENEVGTEWGIFDHRGMLAASYRNTRNVYHAWEYNPDDAGIARWLILDSETRAIAFCEMIAEHRGLAQDPPPDLDQMWKNLTS